MMADFFEHPDFLNNLFIFQLVERLLCNVKIYFFAIRETPSALAIANSTLRIS